MKLHEYRIHAGYNARDIKRVDISKVNISSCMTVEKWFGDNLSSRRENVVLINKPKKCVNCELIKMSFGYFNCATRCKKPSVLNKIKNTANKKIIKNRENENKLSEIIKTENKNWIKSFNYLKKQLRKVFGELKISYSPMSNSIYISLVNDQNYERKIRVSDHSLNSWNQMSYDVLCNIERQGKFLIPIKDLRDLFNSDFNDEGYFNL